MPVTTNLFPIFAPTDTLLDGMEIESDDAGATEFVVPVEPPTQEPEWMLVDPWTLETVREYERRVG
jgi:hypothetical protein